VAAAEEFIDRVRTEYDDATHNVPAYRVPAGEASARTPGSEVMLREYSSDDGEPTGSAGKPALNVLQQRDIRNVVAVVTRYYGGTNLGVGGLARAYSRAVKDGVDEAGVIEERPHRQLVVETAYDDSGDRPRRDRVVGRRVRRRLRRACAARASGSRGRGGVARGTTQQRDQRPRRDRPVTRRDRYRSVARRARAVTRIS